MRARWGWFGRHKVLTSLLVVLILLPVAGWLFKGALVSLLVDRRRAEFLPAEAIEADLRALEERLEARYSYLHRHAYDYRTALGAIRERGAAGMTVGRFAVEIVKFLAPFGDGHTRLRRAALFFPPGYAPFRVRVAREGLVAVHPAGDRLLEESHPLLIAIDGQPVEAWMTAAAFTVARGSEAYVRTHAADRLAYLALLREEMGLPASSRVRVTVGALGSASRRELELELELEQDYLMTLVHRGRPRVNPKPRLLDGGIAYLPIDRMDRDLLPSLLASMARFRESRGLVIDVRGNGGGVRDLLVGLFPYFQRPGDAPRLVNLAALRLTEGLDPEHPEGYLADRFAYPAASAVWSGAEREVIARTAVSFQPEWTPPPGRFSAWHYVLLSPRADPGVYFYSHPVAVLLDSDCFSATDIFLSAFKGHERVTLVGTPSGGGSGRALNFRLTRSRFDLRISSMASFRADGTLHDGRGVEPDLLIEPTIDDLLLRTDSALDAALRVLRTR